MRTEKRIEQHAQDHIAASHSDTALHYLQVACRTVLILFRSWPLPLQEEGLVRRRRVGQQEAAAAGTATGRDPRTHSSSR
jgi:hypothetical protein